ncbi:hypothetical protein N7450_007919 [Penicillium hetheringtonii]|uniref:Uncharacterized protein n=1 Tax=Penicillium hetheringtonii TaxID=911720 RepID=A0AAD6GNN3_9EURO|nr:hypothetical protein N7450_007919 [Penicillium hetheringtonii]
MTRQLGTDPISFHGKNDAHWISGSFKLVAIAVVLTTVMVALGGLVLEGLENADELKLEEDLAGFASTP